MEQSRVLDIRDLLLAALAQDYRRLRRVGWWTLDVAVEPDFSAFFPVVRVVVVNAWPATQPAEEDTLRRIDHNSHMPGPDDQISRLRTRHSLEVIGSVVEIGRTRVGIGKASAKIYGVHKV